MSDSERSTDSALRFEVLTAIVISFGMTAVVVMMSLGAFIEGGDDRVNMPESDRIMPPLKTVDETANEDEKA